MTRQRKPEEVRNYVYKMPKYVHSLEASKLKKKHLSVCFVLQMRLPGFRGKGQTQRVAAV